MHGWKLNKEYLEVRQLRKYNESGLTTHEGAAVAAPLSHIHTRVPADRHTHTYLPCLPPPPPPTYIRRNIAAVVAQMASIFVLPVVVGRHVYMRSCMHMQPRRTFGRYRGFA